VRVLVTGGSGFTGRHLLQRLATEGDAVFAVVRSKAAEETVASYGATPVYGDLDDLVSLDEAFTAEPVDALVNVASLGFGHAPAIVAAAEEAGIPRAVFVSTTAVTTTLNTTSKAVRLAAEAAITSSSLAWTIVRPTMIYGDAGDRNLSRLLSVLRKAPAFPLPAGGRRLQQPIHVADLAAVLSAAVRTDVAVGRTYNVAGPEALTFRQLVRESAAAVGRAPLLVGVPLAPLVAAVKTYQRVSRRPRIKAEQLERLAEDKAFSIDAAVRDLGFAPRSFRDGIRAEAAALPR
jgi:uncharacterized protein YbjT (DUF2867 family)